MLLVALGAIACAIATAFVVARLFPRGEKVQAYQTAVSPSEKTSLILEVNARRVQLLGNKALSTSLTRCPHVGIAVFPDRIRWRSQLRALAFSKRNEYQIADVARICVDEAEPHVLKLLALVPKKHWCCPCCSSPQRELFCTHFFFDQRDDLDRTVQVLRELMHGHDYARLHACTPQSEPQPQPQLGRAPSNPRRVLLLVNPVAGLKRGPEMCARFLDLVEAVYPDGFVDPITHEPLELQVTRTETRGHAFRLAGQLTLRTTAAVVCFGGDGLVHEVVNGLLQQSTPESPDGNRSTIPLLTVPVGTGNGFAMSLGIRPHDVDTAALMFLRGRTQPHDVIAVEHGVAKNRVPPNAKQLAGSGRRVTYCISFVSYGIVSDTDRDSEVLRWLGSLRFTVMALWKVLRSTAVHARISYKPASAVKVTTTETTTEMAAARVLDRTLFSQAQVKDTPVVVNTGHSQTQVEEARVVGVREWREACFMNIPFVSHDIKFGAFADRSDGQVDMNLLPASVSRWRILLIFLLAENGSHVSRLGSNAGHQMHYYKCSEITIEPGVSGQSPEDHAFDIDGEFFPATQPLRLISKPHQLRVFC